MVAEILLRRWSPQPISGHLRHRFPDAPTIVRSGRKVEQVVPRSRLLRIRPDLTPFGISQVPHVRAVSLSRYVFERREMSRMSQSVERGRSSRRRMLPRTGQTEIRSFDLRCHVRKKELFRACYGCEPTGGENAVIEQPWGGRQTASRKLHTVSVPRPRSYEGMTSSRFDAASTSFDGADAEASRTPVARAYFGPASERAMRPRRTSSHQTPATAIVRTKTTALARKAGSNSSADITDPNTTKPKM